MNKDSDDTAVPGHSPWLEEKLYLNKSSVLTIVDFKFAGVRDSS